MNFDGSAFHPELPGGRRSGRLRLGESGVSFDAAGGQFHLPWDGLEVRAGGANNRLIFLSHPARPGVSFHTRDRRILEALRQWGDASVGIQVQRIVTRRRFNWLLLAGIVGGLALLPLVLLLIWNGIIRFAAQQVPVDWEEELGRSALAEYAAQGGLDCDGPAAEQLTELAEVLLEGLADSRYGYRFCISRDETLNAFAVPGGTVVVNRGLVGAAAGAPELLGVLAHEIAHVKAQHGVRAVLNSIGWLAGIQLLFGDASGLVGALVAAAPFLVHMQYSQRFEAEADRLAVDLMVAARVDPAGLVSFFETLQAHNAAQGAEMPAFLRSHPPTGDRIDAIREVLSGKTRPAPPRDLERDFDALRSRLEEED